MMTLRAIAERLLHPGYSHCYRCGRPWACVEGHSTPYADGSACFPLCEGCWGALTPQDRLPFYRQLFVDWRRQGSRVPLAVIEAACLHERPVVKAPSADEAIAALNSEPWEWERVLVDHRGFWLVPHLPVEVRQAWESSRRYSQ